MIIYDICIIRTDIREMPSLRLGLADVVILHQWPVSRAREDMDELFGASYLTGLSRNCFNIIEARQVSRCLQVERSVRCNSYRA